MLFAVDIGTNTVRMLIAEAGTDGRFRPVCHRQQITRLGADITPDRLAPGRIEKTVSVLRLFVKNAQKFPVEKVRAVATEAVRAAANSAEFLETVAQQTGLDVEILTGDEEACLTSLGVFSVLNPQPQAAVIFDLGGGSLEICLCEGEKILWHHSYPIGVVRMAESQDANQIENILTRVHADLQLSGWWDMAKSNVCRLVGTAGTVTTLAAMHLGMDVYEQGRVNNLVLSTKNLQALQVLMAPLDVAGCESLPGMEPGRGDLVPHGLRLILALMRFFHKETLIVSDAGLLEGLVLDMMNPCMPVDT